MRGTLKITRTLRNIIGIIPAHAGNTAHRTDRRATNRDHPRACGEHDLIDISLAANDGSSPRMRGTLHHGQIRIAGTGIIPAHAGNTIGCLKTFRWTRDHPRACGEHSSWMFSCVVFAGSSPRMRGTRDNQRYRDVVEGIIPAHAGNTVNL